MPMHRTNKSKSGRHATAYREGIGRTERCENWWVVLRRHSRRRDRLARVARRINRRIAKGKR
jgi:hypothetical protein